MRVKNTIKNMKVGLIFTIIYLVCNFVGRAIFIKMLGGNVAGFNTLILNLMSFLSVAELGISMAITYSLYKPLTNREYSKINEIMILFKYYYKNIAKIIFISGSILAMSLIFFIKEQMPMKQAYIYYFMFLFNTVIGYFYIYKQTLMIADQKQYVIVAITNSIKIIKVFIQIMLIYMMQSYFLWIIVEMVSNIINLQLINNKFKKLYPNIEFKSDKSIEKIKKENSDIIKNMKNVFFHKIAGFIVFQTDGILISLFLSLKQTAIYGNYSMVTNGVLSIFNSVMSSFTASIGNLLAEDNNKKNFTIFKKLYLLDHFMAIVVTYMIYNIINDFIILWVGEAYLFNKTIVFVLMVNVYIQIIRGTVEKFKDTYGIFWDKYAPITEGIINFAISYILIQYIGIIGLFIGTLISNIVIILIWKPYVVYRYGFKRNAWEHIKLFFKMIVTAGIIFLIVDVVVKCILFNIRIKNIYFDFIVSSVVKFGAVGTITLSIFLMNKDFKEMINMVLKNKKVTESKQQATKN